MDKNEEANQFLLMRQASRDIRGHYLEIVTEFEWLIEIYISNYFAGKDNEKFNDFMSLVIKPNVTFRNKVETFKILMEKVDPNFGVRNPTYSTDFQNIIQDRNVFAHDPMVTVPTAVQEFKENKSVGYYKYKPRKKDNKIELHSITKFTDTQINDKIQKIINYIEEILIIIEKN